MEEIKNIEVLFVQETWDNNVQFTAKNNGETPEQLRALKEITDNKGIVWDITDIHSIDWLPDSAKTKLVDEKNAEKFIIVANAYAVKTKAA